MPRPLLGCHYYGPWSDGPPPNFKEQCHLTKLSFSCKHEMWLKNPAVFHVPACTYVFSDKDNHRCGNMAKCPRLVVVHTPCPNCSNLPGIHKRKCTVSEATSGEAEEAAAETGPEDWKLAPEFQEIEAEISHKSSSTSTGPKITSKTKQENWSDTATQGTGSSESSDTKYFESHEASSTRKAFTDTSRPASLGSWVEVEGETGRTARGDDEGSLAQTQADRWLMPTKWLMGFIGLG